MFKKLMAILIVALLMLSCVGTAVMAEGDTVTTTVNVLEEVLIKSTDPDSTDNISESRAVKDDNNNVIPGVYWYCHTLDDSSANTSTVLQKYDLNGYVYPVDYASIYIEYRGSGDNNIMVFKAPSDWSSENATWNNFVVAKNYDISKGGENYINSVDGTDVSDRTYTRTLEITDYVNETLLRGERYISFAYDRNVAEGKESENTFRLGTGVSKITVRQSEPVYEKTGESTINALYCDRTHICTSNPDSPADNFTTSYGFYSKSSTQSSAGITNSSDTQEPYGISSTNYIKFDLSKFDLSNKKIKEVTISYGATSNNRGWGVYHYIIDDNSWNGYFKTGNPSGTEIVWNDVFPKNAEGTVEPTKYAPNIEKFVYNAPGTADNWTGIKPTANDNGGIMQGPFNITSIVKPEIESPDFDGKISIAVMVKDQVKTDGNSSRRNVRLIFNSGKSGVMDYITKNNSTLHGPYLNITYEDNGVVTSPKENISFKINDAEASTLSNGVFKAETTITNTMHDSTKATLLMCVYEGNKLKEIFVKPALVNNKNVSGGITNVFVSSGKEIEVTENTKVGVYLWKDLLFPIPVNSGKVFTAQ